MFDGVPKVISLHFFIFILILLIDFNFQKSNQKKFIILRSRPNFKSQSAFV